MKKRQEKVFNMTESNVTGKASGLIVRQKVHCYNCGRKMETALKTFTSYGVAKV